MDVGADHLVCVVKDLARVVGKDDLSFGSFFLYELFIIIYIVYVSESVPGFSEQAFKFLLSQHILIRVYALFIEKINVQQVVAHFVAGIAEHEDDLLCTFGHASEADGKSVPAENRENNSDGFSAQFSFHIGSQLVGSRIVGLGSCQDGFGHCENIFGADLKITVIYTGHQSVYGDLFQVIALFYDRAPQSS